MKKRVGNLWLILAIIIAVKSIWIGFTAKNTSLLSFLAIIYYGENLLEKYKDAEQPPLAKERKLEVIDASRYTKCWSCDGTGKRDGKVCSACQGTGKWKEPNYIHIVKDENGQKIAFQSDLLK